MSNTPPLNSLLVAIALAACGEEVQPVAISPTSLAASKMDLTLQALEDGNLAAAGAMLDFADTLVMDSVTRATYDSLTAERMRLRTEGEVKRRDALATLRSSSDEFTETTFYYEPSSPRSARSNNLQAYIATAGGQTQLRSKVSYTGEDWLFVRRYVLLVDGVTHDIYPGEVERDNAGGDVWEWSDDVVDESLLLTLEAAALGKDVKLRYIGDKYHHDRRISKRERKALRAVVEAYRNIAGTETW